MFPDRSVTYVRGPTSCPGNRSTFTGDPSPGSSNGKCVTRCSDQSVAHVALSVGRPGEARGVGLREQETLVPCEHRLPSLASLAAELGCAGSIKAAVPGNRNTIHGLGALPRHPAFADVVHHTLD